MPIDQETLAEWAAEDYPQKAKGALFGIEALPKTLPFRIGGNDDRRGILVDPPLVFGEFAD